MGGISSGLGAALNPSMALGSATTGIGGKSKAPSAPDFAGAAEAQAASGHVNQNNAFGSTGWVQGPDGRWTQSTSMAPGLATGIAGLEGQIANQGPLGTGDQARDQAITGIYNQAASRLNPQWSQARESEQAQLANQGLTPGSQAYDNAMGNFNRAQNDAYSSAMNNAIAGGTAAQQATFGENLAAQNAPYTQLGALNGLQSGLSGMGPQTQYLPGAMAQYQGDLQSYGIQQAGKNSTMNGLGDMALAAKLGGPAVAASDAKLKRDIERLPVDALPGVSFARWKWRDGSGDGFGVIAQDVLKVRPDLVHRHPDGYLMVDYSFLGED